jgi:ketosteroid isomerase-like protein
MTTKASSPRAQQNAELLLRAHELFMAGDTEALRELVSPQFVWHSVGKNLLAGDYRGLDAWAKFGEQAMKLSNGTYRPETLDVAGSEQHAMYIGRLTATRNGKKLDVLESVVLRVRDGKFVEGWQVPFDQYASDNFWS